MWLWFSPGGLQRQGQTWQRWQRIKWKNEKWSIVIYHSGTSITGLRTRITRMRAECPNQRGPTGDRLCKYREYECRSTDLQGHRPDLPKQRWSAKKHAYSPNTKSKNLHFNTNKHIDGALRAVTGKSPLPQRATCLGGIWGRNDALYALWPTCRRGKPFARGDVGTLRAITPSSAPKRKKLCLLAQILKPETYIYH